MSYPIVQKNHGRFYLYEAESHWDPEKKRPYQTRTYIGTCDENGRLIAKATRQRTVSVSKTFGPYYLMLEIAGRCGLYDRLSEVFGEERADILTALAVSRTVHAEPMCGLEDGMEESFLPELLGIDWEFTSSQLTRFMQDLGRSEEAIYGFFRASAEPGETVIFDITSFSTSSEELDLAEYGRKYRTTKLPQVNMGMAASVKTGLPFFYKLYPGGVSDMAAVRNLVADLKDLGSDGIHIVADRGFFSESNLSRILEAKFGFSLPVPSGNNIFKYSVSEAVRPPEDPLNADIMGDSAVRCFETAAEICGAKIRTLVFQDDGRRHSEIKTLYSKIAAFELSVSQKKWNPGKICDLTDPEKELLSMFDIAEGKDGKASAVRKRNAVSARENRCGRFVILTTSEERWQDVLFMQRRRNDIEQNFADFKTELEGGVKYLSGGDSVQGMIFAEFVSLILRTELLRIMRETELLKKMRVPDVFRIMRKLKITRIGEEWRLNEVTKKQKDLFGALGVKPPQDSY
ncbi:MAG: transposase [Candidatus Methanoplasma sp.]|jgi:transposase|nr:transposase [Candidatus Methanoplasma sp.]